MCITPYIPRDIPYPVVSTTYHVYHLYAPVGAPRSIPWYYIHPRGMYLPWVSTAYHPVYPPEMGRWHFYSEHLNVYIRVPRVYPTWYPVEVPCRIPWYAVVGVCTTYMGRTGGIPVYRTPTCGRYPPHHVHQVCRYPVDSAVRRVATHHEVTSAHVRICIHPPADIPTPGGVLHTTYTTCTPLWVVYHGVRG